MRAKLANAWDNTSASLWFIPTVLALAAVGLAALALFVDEHAPDLGGHREWLFGGTADSARALLSAIAGSLITVVALAFSITIVAVQQASTQFSPRVIRNFMRDRGNQLVFGVYIATFTYALLVLRQVREPAAGPDGGAFVPALAITLALALALVCVALLIYYIHHIAASLQVATITDEIRRELRQGLDALYPREVGAPPRPAREEGGDDGPLPPDSRPSFVVQAEEAGFLRAIDEEQLLDALGDAVTVARVRPQVGQYVVSGATLVEGWCDRPIDTAPLERGIRQACTIERERSPRQDILFGMRQLNDIALKALSPGINDPTTAEHCLSHLGDVVAQLAERPFPAARRRAPRSGTVLLLNRPDFGAAVDAAFSQIRREAKDDVHVTGYLLDVLAQIAPRCRSARRAAAIRGQVAEVLEALPDQAFSAADKAGLRERAAGVLTLLERAAGADGHGEVRGAGWPTTGTRRGEARPD